MDPSEHEEMHLWLEGDYFLSPSNDDLVQKGLYVTATPALSQRLTQAQQEVCESSHLKLDWMIQWM
ncbi:hypothetical protein Gotur_029499 [Gossypium turneri]